MDTLTPNETTSPRVSVVIPSFNHENFVMQAVASVMRQTYRDLEVIIVDDGSTDNTFRRIRECQDRRLVYIRQENAGLSAARNAGIASARGEIIALLDADDLFESGFLASAVQRLDVDPQLQAVYAGYRMIDEEGRALSYSSTRSERPERLFQALLNGNFFPPSCVTARKTAYGSAGAFDTTLTACEDWDMWLRMAKSSRIAGIPEILLNYRILSDGMSSDAERMANNRMRVLNRHLARVSHISEEIKSRALAWSELRCAVEYIQAGDTGRAQQALRRVAAADASLLEETHAYYELACASNRRGNGDVMDSALRKAASDTVLGLVASLFSAESTFPELGRSSAASAAHIALARLHYKGGDLRATRSHLLCAVRLRPRSIRSDGALAMLAKTLLGSRTLRQLRTLRSHGVRRVSAVA